MRYDTIKDAVYAWVETFNAVPMSVIEKIINYDIEKNGVESINEITPPAVGNRVYVFADQNEGEIVKYDKENDLYEVKFDSGEKKMFEQSDIEVIIRDPFPMWGTMWALSDPTDIEWANGEHLGPHLQEVADCGFRIYESEDFGILLGVDGAGYNFYDEHWIPLYKARGLQWHKGAA